jgi:ABC-type glycerol-3-phosphate transport system substrate-binding protein
MFAQVLSANQRIAVVALAFVAGCGGSSGSAASKGLTFTGSATDGETATIVVSGR